MAQLQQRLNKQGQDHILGLAQTVKNLWIKACEHDMIDPGERIVVFSTDNPFMPFYDNAYRQLQEAIQAYKAGGYVGISL
jgi:hypothetical protein